jgi:hypothetical protein
MNRETCPEKRYSGFGRVLKSRFILVSFLSPLLILFLLPAAVSAASKAPAAGKLVDVSGKVTISGEAGQKSHAAKKGAKVAEGERIVTSEDATAVLEFFDGSQLTLQPGTELSVVRLKKSPSQGDVLKFKLSLGKILAEVAKMLSINSRFEIEAGGVVCGVRGTKFTLQYDPGRQKLSLRVAEGSVYADSGGKHRVLNAGEKIEFIKGRPAAEEDAGSAASSQRGFADPALKDLHEQFSGSNRTYREKAVNDPAAAGLKTKKNPNSSAGVIEAKP